MRSAVRRADDGSSRLQGEEATIEELVARIVADPSSATAGGAADSVGLRPHRLDELMVRHYHATTADMIERSKLRVAGGLLLAGMAPANIAGAVGFESTPAFEVAFERRMAIAARDFVRILDGRFDLGLPSDYPTTAILGYLGRDPASPSERVHGTRYEVALRVATTPIAVRVTFESGRARCEVVTGILSDGLAIEIHARLMGRLGLALDPGGFEARVRSDPGLSGVIDGREGLRIPLVGDPFDTLIWVIAGQQVSLAAAFSMRRKLIAETGTRVGDLVAPPGPGDVADLTEDLLGSLGFSRAKSRALHELSASIAGGGLRLDELRNASATRIERTLLEVRGLGPWSVNYVLMRGYGFADCVPVGDVALMEGLRRFFGLSSRPGPQETLELMAPFRPYRSLATFHLWRISARGG